MAAEGEQGRARGAYGKSAERRQQIIDSAIELFAGGGVDAGSYRSVAAAIGVSHTALRYYFPSREELLIAVYAAHEHRDDAEEWLGDDRSPIEAMQESATRNRQVPGLVQLYTALVADAVQAGHPTARAYITERFAAVRRRVGRHVERSQEHGAIRPEVDAPDVAALIVAASDGLQLQWLLDPDEVSIEDALAVLGDALAGGDAA